MRLGFKITGHDDEAEKSAMKPVLTPDYYWCKEWKTWVLLYRDAEGNQVGDAEYFFRKSFLKKEIKERQVSNGR